MNWKTPSALRSNIIAARHDGLPSRRAQPSSLWNEPGERDDRAVGGRADVLGAGVEVERDRAARRA